MQHNSGEPMTNSMEKSQSHTTLEYYSYEYVLTGTVVTTNNTLLHVEKCNHCNY